MISVTVTDGDQVEFDAANILHYDGAVDLTHRDVMRSCDRTGIWYRVAHAA